MKTTDSRPNSDGSPPSPAAPCSGRTSEAERLSRELTEFNRERDQALMSLDEEQIRAMFRKWNEREMPADPEVFWGAVHKAITGALNLPIELRRKSKTWLTEHGLRSLDDGEL